MATDRQLWVGKVVNLVVTKENEETDWVVVRFAGKPRKNEPKWYALELSHRTPTSLAIFNILRDAMKSGRPVRLVVNRNNSPDVDWQDAVIVGVESPRLARREDFRES
jgi:hypothetical protein